MADNEIKKAWECCENWESTKDCDDCPVKVGCSQKLAKYSLDLIKCKDAEIERLNDYNLNLITANTALSNEILEIKSEAIKEFAEKLKKRFYLCAGRCVVDVYHIDNLVKEMTE